MSDRDALLRAVLDNPEDDAPRLIFADYIDERGEPERAEFVKLQIELAQLKSNWIDYALVHPNDGIETELKWLDTRDILLNREKEIWHAPLILTELPDISVVELHCSIDSNEVLTRNGIRCLVRRGFVDSITCSATDAISHLDAILAAQPVQEVTLTTWPELQGYRERSLVRLPGRTTHTIRPARDFSETTQILLESEWPQIKKWNLPPQQQYGPSPLRAAFRTWQEAIDAQAYSMRHFSR